VINLGNLNVHFAIPVFSKPGRGIPFDYSLSLDSSVWTPVPTGGTASWLPDLNWGWRAITEAATGFISYDTNTIQCLIDPGGILMQHPRFVNKTQYSILYTTTPSAPYMTASVMSVEDATEKMTHHQSTPAPMLPG
jgi:hypothetical protein